MWPLRKLCLEVAPDMIALLSDMDAFLFILNFLKLSLKPYEAQPSNETNGIEEEQHRKKTELWVRNQAMAQFGKIIHGIYLKQPNDKVKSKLREVSESFYDLSLLAGK